MFSLTNGLSRVLVAAIAAVIAHSSLTAHAATIYDANVPRKFLPTDADPLYYQVGPNSGANRIMFDDVPVNYNAAIPIPIANVNRVSFDISRRGLAPSVIITAYYAPMVLDSLQSGDPDPNNDSAVFDDPGAPVQIGSVTLSASTSSTGISTSRSYKVKESSRMAGEAVMPLSRYRGRSSARIAA